MMLQIAPRSLRRSISDPLRQTCLARAVSIGTNMAMRALSIALAPRPMPTRLAFYRLLPLAGALAVLALVVGPLARPLAPPPDAPPAPAPPAAAALQALWAQQPLAFEPNHGQAEAGVDFLVRGA